MIKPIENLELNMYKVIKLLISQLLHPTGGSKTFVTLNPSKASNWSQASATHRLRSVASVRSARTA